MSIYYDLGQVVGPQGPQGPQGPRGPQGPAGPGGGLPSGGSVGQVLTKTADGAAWADPAGGSGKQDKITASGLLKGNGNGGVSAAVAGTDYQAPLTAGADYQTPLTAGTDYATPASVPAASSAAPQMDGTAAAGSSSAFARADHVHPADTGRQAKITASGVLSGDGNGNITAKAVDTAPASGSGNLITSGAVYTAILGAIGGSY